MSSDLSRYPWHMMHGLASAIHENQTRSLLPGAPTEPCSAVASCTDNGPGASKKPRLGDTSKAGPGNQQECQKLAQTPNAKQGQHSACGTSREADGHQDPLWIIHPRKGSNLTTPTPPAVRPGRRTQGQTGGSPPRHVAQRTAHNSAGGAFRETSTSSQHEARSDQTGSQQTGEEPLHRTGNNLRTPTPSAVRPGRVNCLFQTRRSPRGWIDLPTCLLRPGYTFLMTNFLSP